jgi:hypothetical protein
VKKSKFTEEQIAYALKQADGLSVVQCVQRNGASEPDVTDA